MLLILSNFRILSRPTQKSCFKKKLVVSWTIWMKLLWLSLAKDFIFAIKMVSKYSKTLKRFYISKINKTHKMIKTNKIFWMTSFWKSFTKKIRSSAFKIKRKAKPKLSKRLYWWMQKYLKWKKRFKITYKRNKCNWLKTNRIKYSRNMYLNIKANYYRWMIFSALKSSFMKIKFSK